MTRVTLAALALLPLCACGPSKRADLAECQMKAREVYPDQTGDKTDLQHTLQKTGDYTFLCMEAKGYVGKCHVGRGWVAEETEDCYRKAWPWE